MIDFQNHTRKSCVISQSLAVVNALLCLCICFVPQVAAQVASPLPSSISDHGRRDLRVTIKSEAPATNERQRVLSEELRMPPLGLDATARQLEKRFDYASMNSWVDPMDLETLQTELNEIKKQQEYVSNSGGVVNAGERLKLSQRLFKLNESFESLVFGPSMSVQGKILWKALEGLDKRPPQVDETLSKADSSAGAAQ